jgi:hypothetical protein
MWFPIKMFENMTPLKEWNPIDDLNVDVIT